MEVRLPPSWFVSGLAGFHVVLLAADDAERAGLCTLHSHDGWLGATILMYLAISGAGFFLQVATQSRNN